MRTPAKRRSLVRQVYLEQELAALLAQCELELYDAGRAVDAYYAAIEEELELERERDLGLR
jgi:hypothetical protein